MRQDNWYLGLDIGTNSVGYAVTDESYNLHKFKDNAMWGFTLFEDAHLSAERRSFRTARKTLERKKQRVFLLGELLAKEISKVDDKFFVRLKESNLYLDDKSQHDKNALFNDSDFNDKQYHKKYPTVYHLINDLGANQKKHDIRLIYLAASYILSHRGHFLSKISKDNISEVTKLDSIYKDFEDWFSEAEIAMPWECDVAEFSDILKEKLSITAKEKKFFDLLFSGKKPKVSESYPFDKALMIKLICGGEITLSKLFNKSEYEENPNSKISFNKADFDDILEALYSELSNNDAELISILKTLYDWSVLINILGEHSTISKAKIAVYEQHKKDLTFLKYAVRKYLDNGDSSKKYSVYKKVFRAAGKEPNYVSYSGNVNALSSIPADFKKTNSAEEFCKYIKKLFEKVTPLPEDKANFDDMLKRLEIYTFCPRQVTPDNRTIPYQLYWHELNLILTNAAKHYEFLNVSDEYGTVKDKILSILEFRIPYFAGPLNTYKNQGWIKKKADEKIYPWNFHDIVDFEESEKGFIRRMTNKCTYLPDRDVLPKNSLLYTKFNVLNEINNLKIDSIPISVEIKKEIYHQLFLKYQKVTLKRIKTFLTSKGLLTKDSVLTGIDIEIKSNLKPHFDFRNLLQNNILTEAEVEKIIERMTFTEDKNRLVKWLSDNSIFNLSKNDVDYIAGLRYSGFGRLSKEFLTEICPVCEKTGEVSGDNIITALMNTNCNLMELLSSRYGYIVAVRSYQCNYFSLYPKTLDERLDEMRISNSVKRPIFRTMDIVKELNKIMLSPPKKIFVEMAREKTGENKGKRTESRKTRIEKLYKSFSKNPEISALLALLNTKTDSEFRREKLFLYFMQLGKCMYTGENIDIESLETKRYDIDHIFPQSKVKDDSFDNKVLVVAEENGRKKDSYPVSENIRTKMHDFWKKLKDNGGVSEEKFYRLTRSFRFTDEEKAGFINRQLVETRQSTKAVATLLGEKFPESEIVYVKAGLTSDFRHYFKMEKCREINSLHHAKDAYLNIVVGNIYNTKFTKNPLNFIKSDNAKYSMKLKNLLKHDIVRGDTVAWVSDDSTLKKVKDTYYKNTPRYTRFSFVRKGGLFKVTPLRKGLGQVPLKAGVRSDISKYGGYDSATISYFLLIKCTLETIRKKGVKIDKITRLMPIPLHLSERLNTESEIVEYVKKEYGYKDIVILLNNRKIKIDTLFEFDGFRAHLSGKTGDSVTFKGGMQLVLSKEDEKYYKKIFNYDKKCKAVFYKELPAITKYDELDCEKNVDLYQTLIRKLKETTYGNLLQTPLKLLGKHREDFKALSVERQSLVLSKIINIFTCNATHADMRELGESKDTAIIKVNMSLSKSSFKNIFIIDQSPTGLFEKKSANLLEL